MSIVLSPQVPVLGKRKDTDPCRSQFDDTCRSQFHDTCRTLLFAEEKEKEKEEEEEEEEEEEDEEKLSSPCYICKVLGHYHVHCPWRNVLPFGPLPDIPSIFWVSCRGCYDGKFNESNHCCTNCGSRNRKVILKRCWMCLRVGHMDNSDPGCSFFEKEFNYDTDFMCNPR